jgi:hypothetical protein
VPSTGTFTDEDFAGLFLAHSDDYLFWSNGVDAIRVYALTGDVPERVRTLSTSLQVRGMAVHRATGTLLAACCTREGDAYHVGLLDTRPPPSQWAFAETDRAALQDCPLTLALDEANGFLYVNGFTAQRFTQFTVALRTPDERKSASGSSSTVDLKLTAARVLDAPIPANCVLTGAIAVLSREELLVYHHIQQLSILTHTFSGASSAPDSKSFGGATARDQLGPWRRFNAVKSSACACARALWVDWELRCVFAAEYLGGHVTVHDLDSGQLLCVVRDKGSAFADLIDGVLLIVEPPDSEEQPQSRIHFVAVDSIPELRGRYRSR